MPITRVSKFYLDPTWFDLTIQIKYEHICPLSSHILQKRTCIFKFHIFFKSVFVVYTSDCEELPYFGGMPNCYQIIRGDEYLMIKALSISSKESPNMVGIHLTVEKWAKRMPNPTVETTICVSMLELISRATPSVEAHHRSVGPDSGR